LIAKKDSDEASDEIVKLKKQALSNE